MRKKKEEVTEELVQEVKYPTVEELVIECIKHDIPVNGVDYNGRNLEYEIGGFSKSGTGKLTTDEDGNTILVTRYNTVNEVRSFEDIADVAYDWYYNYRDREPFTQPDYNWAPIFVEMGLIEERIVKTYVPVVQ